MKEDIFKADISIARFMLSRKAKPFVKTATYETVWCNKLRTADSNSVDDMINVFARSIEMLQEVKKDNIEVDFQSAKFDYIFFRTQDPEIAKKYDMDKLEGRDNDEKEGISKLHGKSYKNKHYRK